MFLIPEKMIMFEIFQYQDTTDAEFSDGNIKEFYDFDTPDCDTQSDIDLNNILLKYSSQSTFHYSSPNNDEQGKCRPTHVITVQPVIEITPRELMMAMSPKGKQ